MSWEENWVKDLEYIERNYPKEIDEYNDKYFRKDVFDRIIKKLKDNNFMIELDEFYEEDEDDEEDGDYDEFEDDED